MSTSWTRAQRVKNDCIYLVVRVVLAMVRLLPRSVLIRAGRGIGTLAWHVAPRTRALAEANLRRAFPGADTSRLLRATYRELGALLGDTLALLHPKEPVRLAFVPGARDVLERARNAGRGVVLITAHLGPWERLAAALVAEGFALTTPVRRSYDPRLEQALHAPLRRTRGVEAIDRDAPGTPRALVRALRRGDVAGFLVDLNTRVASARVSFFGAPAWTPTGPARLALRTGAPVVAAFATRNGIVVEEVRSAAAPAEASDEAVLALTQAMTAHVERAIADEPERWIWMHDRWGDRREKATSDALVRAPA